MSKTVAMVVATVQPAAAAGGKKAIYVLGSHAAHGKVYTDLRRWEVCDGMRSTDLMGHARTLAVQARSRVTSKVLVEAHRLGAGDLDAVRLALAGIATKAGDLPCPSIDDAAVRSQLAALSVGDVREG